MGASGALAPGATAHGGKHRGHKGGRIPRDHISIDAGSPPRTPAQAPDTARVGYEYLAGLSLRRRRR